MSGRDVLVMAFCNLWHEQLGKLIQHQHHLT